MHAYPTLTALLLSGLSTFAFAAGQADTCCNLLQNADGLDGKVLLPSDAAYDKSIKSYFAVNAQLEPYCVVQPRTSDDVAAAAKTLTAAGSSCKFAVRSGGHTTWAGAADIEDGVTIDLSMMNSTVYNKEAGTASIQAGSRWQQVYKTLEPHGVTVPGGRGGPVGVGGFLVGGGNTFHTARIGFACDNVENFEVVLASGEIVNANKKQHKELYKALKGGSINFGIVTKYDLKTLPQDKLWGGVVAYDNSTTPQHISAAQKFINNIHKDPYASWIGMWQYDSKSGQHTIGTALHYTKPEAYPEAFGDFYKIPNMTDTMRFAGMYNLTQELAQASGLRDVFITATYVNKKEALQRTIDLHNEALEEAKAKAQSKSWTMITIMQPWPKLFTEQSRKRSENVLGLERFDENLFQVLFDYSWDNKADDALFRRLATTALEQLNEYAKSIDADNEYIYLNYADKTQNPLRGYGEENIEFMRQVARKYDPAGVFQYQVPGGFKLSSA